jgi:hypothetical protein
MKTILFVSRVTFIYNLCMLGALLIRFYDFMPEGAMRSTILIGGLVLSVAFNTAWVLCIGFLFIRGKKWKFFQPVWLFAVNFLCFIFQIYLLLS